MPKTTQKQRAFVSVDDYARAGRLSRRSLSKIKNLALNTDIIDRLVLERVRAGLTQTELSRRLGSSQSYISKFEDSLDAELTIGEIDRYCMALNLKVGLFIKS